MPASRHPAPGMTDQEVHRIAEGPKAPGWTDFERTLLRMVDELRYDAMIGDATWRALRKEYSDQQMMEALFTAAQYQLVSMALNSLGRAVGSRASASPAAGSAFAEAGRTGDQARGSRSLASRRCVASNGRHNNAS